MTTFFMFGNYSSDSLKRASSDRTKEAQAIIQKLGGKVNSMYALLGRYDLILIVEFSDMENAMKASIELNKMSLL